MKKDRKRVNTLRSIPWSIELDNDEVVFGDNVSEIGVIQRKHMHMLSFLSRDQSSIAQKRHQHAEEQSGT